MLTIAADIMAAIVAHARRDHPDEACGIVGGAIGSDNPTRHIPMTNADRSMTLFRFDDKEYPRVWGELDDRDEDILVVYHSHTATEAYPSRSDIDTAGWSEAHYLLVSTRDPDTTEIRSFRIVDGVVTEEEVRLVGGTMQDMLTQDGEVASDGATGAVQSYMFGQSPTTVDYECRSGT